jgi:hypothetical protein
LLTEKVCQHDDGRCLPHSADCDISYTDDFAEQFFLGEDAPVIKTISHEDDRSVYQGQKTQQPNEGIQKRMRVICLPDLSDPAMKFFHGIS